MFQLSLKNIHLAAQAPKKRRYQASRRRTDRSRLCGCRLC